MLSPTATSPMLDQEGEIHFSLLNSYYVDQRRTTSQETEATQVDVNKNATLALSQLYTSHTGLDAAYQYYSTIHQQDISSVTAPTVTQLSFIFHPSDIVYQTTVTEKSSQAQFLFSILSSVVSLYSLFIIIFKCTEFVLKKFGVSLVDVTLLAIYQQEKGTPSSDASELELTTNPMTVINHSRSAVSVDDSAVKNMSIHELQTIVANSHAQFMRVTGALEHALAMQESRADISLAAASRSYRSATIELGSVPIDITDSTARLTRPSIIAENDANMKADTDPISNADNNTILTQQASSDEQAL
jgi:hypothetical protein